MLREASDFRWGPEEEGPESHFRGGHTHTKTS